MDHDAIPLTELGTRQAQAVAAALDVKPSRILVSAYLRTADTAAPFCAKVGMVADVHPALHEFSTIDPAWLAGMNGEQRRPIADAYWREADPARRMGPLAETFEEFERRVRDFMPELDHLPDQTVLFGHGMWLGMVVWKLLGFGLTDSLGMKAFRRFQQGLPMPNCAVYRLLRSDDGHWRARVDEQVLRRVSSLTAA